MSKKDKLGVTPPERSASDALVIASQEAERKRLALELHDGVGQILTGIKFRLESLPERLSLRNADEADIRKLGAYLDQAIAEVRRVSRKLMPPELVDLGLEPALVKLCRDYEECWGGAVTVRTASTHATPELSLTLFRIAQEALNNIGKHSRATKVAVALSCEGEDVVLVVKDNGVGFCASSRRHGEHGIGLGNMRRRAEAAGGWLELSSRRGEGTTLSVRVPASGIHGGAS